MNTKALLRSGFCNSMFLSRNPQIIRNFIARIINDSNISLFPNKPSEIKVETINSMSDCVTLTFDDEKVSTIWKWRKSIDGKSFVLDKIE